MLPYAGRAHAVGHLAWGCNANKGRMGALREGQLQVARAADLLDLPVKPGIQDAAGVQCPTLQLR